MPAPTAPSRLGDWATARSGESAIALGRMARLAALLLVAVGMLAIWVGAGLYGTASALPGETRTTGTVLTPPGITDRSGDLAVVFYATSGEIHEVALPAGGRSGYSVGDRVQVAYGQPDSARVLVFADDPARTAAGTAAAAVGALMIAAGALWVLSASAWPRLERE